MIKNDRKTKRNSPPPLSTTIVDHHHSNNKFLQDSFSKWTKVLQLISPPNKKRRAFQEQQRLQKQQQQDRWFFSSDNSSSEEDEESDSDDEDQTVVNKPYIITKSQSTPSLLKRDKSIESQLNNKQKMLNRRGMYIPTSNINKIIHDGPKDAWHQWNLYRRTCQRLRQAGLPLLEIVHLRKMLVNLQPISMMKTSTTNSLTDVQRKAGEAEEEEEDNVPLGALLEKNKRSPSPPSVMMMRQHNINGVFDQKRQYDTLPPLPPPPPPTIPQAAYTPQVNTHYYNPYKQMHQSCYYNNISAIIHNPSITVVKFT